MLTSQQICDARDLLGWSRAELSRRTLLKPDVIDQAEERDGNALLHYGQEISIRRVRTGLGRVRRPAAERAARLRSSGLDIMKATGRHLREARELLGLSPSGLMVKARRVTTATVKLAESDNPGPSIAEGHIRVIQATLERLGIEFTPDGPKLRKVEP